MFNKIKYTFRQTALFSLLTMFTLAGCQRPRPNAEQLDEGLIIMLAGIEGGWLNMSEAQRGFRLANVSQAIEQYRWHHSMWPFTNLMDSEANARSAHKLADHITQYAQTYPDRPIDLVGYSGGGGIAILAAEELPDDITLRHIILIHAAISPDYDLTDALHHTHGNLINVHSRWDWFMVGLGTRVFGTIDRQFGPSAGMIGFNLDKACPNPQDRSRIIQSPWSFDDLKNRRWGGHFAIHLFGINHNYIAPYLLTDRNTQSG